MAAYAAGMRRSPLSLHYEQLIGLTPPWRVVGVQTDHDGREVQVRVECRPEARLRCPECNQIRGGYDTRERRWRHLDTMQYQTVLIAQVPRVRCDEHGVRQITVSWAEEGSRLTAMFEALVIDWLHEANFSAVARLLGLSWDQVAGIQGRAVKRGLARRERTAPTRIGIDETSFAKRHEYVTVVHDQIDGIVLYVADGRKRDSIDAFFEGIGDGGCEGLQSIAMDMWPPYIGSVRNYVPEADSKLVFDKFHIAKHLGDAVDQVRRQENKALRADGDDRLAKTRYQWLTNPERMSRKQWLAFAPLRDSTLKVARAWAIKELAMSLWGYARRGWAERMWQRWYSWAIRSKLDPIKRVARMVKKHWNGVINAATTDVTNARAESLNSKIQWVKRQACGFRNRESFRNAIYFHLGGLDLYPAIPGMTHSKS